MGQQPVRICQRCVLPEYPPDIRLNEEGVCNFCVDFAKRSSQKNDRPLLESDLITILEKHRAKAAYDCLVMCSGGKDSTASLYYMKKRYRMKVLAFTFDHGFENPVAVQNVRNAVEILGVDWLYFKSDFMKPIFKKVLDSRSPAPLCHVCALWYIERTCDIAARYSIPVIVAGWTKGQSDEAQDDRGGALASMSRATAEFVKRFLHPDPLYKNFPVSMGEVLRRARRKSKMVFVSPHWFIRYEPETIMAVLRKELKWEKPAASFPKDSTNCLMNFVSVSHSMRHYGYTHYHVELSTLVRRGELSRQEALELLAPKHCDRDCVHSIVTNLGCNLTDI